MPDALIIGIDGGGSKTLALLAQADGSILGRGEAGSSNYHVTGLQVAYAALDASIQASFQSAGLHPRPIAALCLGMAGVDRPTDHQAFLSWAAARYPGAPVVIVNDARLVLAAGTPEGWGIALISGTGSICVGAGPDGEIRRAGGWGYLMGDEGSGYRVGLDALQAVARAADGRDRATILSEMILNEWTLHDPQDLINRVYTPQTTRTDIARLAMTVEAAAIQGDPVANTIIETAGNELALAAAAVARALGMADSHLPCGLAGSVLVRGQLVRKAFERAAFHLDLQLDPVTPVPEPAQGALRLARELVC